VGDEGFEPTTSSL